MNKIANSLQNWLLLSVITSKLYFKSDKHFLFLIIIFHLTISLPQEMWAFFTKFSTKSWKNIFVSSSICANVFLLKSIYHLYEVLNLSILAFMSQLFQSSQRSRKSSISMREKKVGMVNDQIKVFYAE